MRILHDTADQFISPFLLIYALPSHISFVEKKVLLYYARIARFCISRNSEINPLRTAL